MKVPRFEHKTHPVLPFPKFLARVFRFFMVSITLLLLSLGLGTAGYHYFGEINWIDAFYNASMILTGMGPVNAMNSNAAKIFSSLYALFSGIIFLSTVAVIFAPIAHRLLHLMHVEENRA